MKKISLPLIVLAILLASLFNAKTTNAQTVDLLGGNILNGTLTGTILGISVMGLQNSSDFAPLRVGVGAGILGGTGIALYDITTLPQGQQFFISGRFNDGNNSSIIILLDTLYGVGTGAVIGTAVMLIRNKPLVDGLQFGGSAGAWVGFGYGLVDAFMLAERNRDFVASDMLQRTSLFQKNGGGVNIKVGEPALYRTVTAEDGALDYKINPGVKLFSISRQF